MLTRHTIIQAAPMVMIAGQETRIVIKEVETS